MMGKPLTIAVTMLLMVSGCVAVNGYRALDTDEMEMNPVCEIRLKRFVPAADSAAMEYKGKTVYFCCADCVEKFKKYTARHEKSGNVSNGRGAHNGSGAGHNH